MRKTDVTYAFVVAVVAIVFFNKNKINLGSSNSLKIPGRANISKVFLHTYLYKGLKLLAYLLNVMKNSFRSRR